MEITYDSPTADNWKKESFIHNGLKSKWGYNVDDRAYCRLRRGDKRASIIILNIYKLYSDFDWHILNGHGKDESYCADEKKLLESNN